jgi:hypothetical protein
MSHRIEAPTVKAMVQEPARTPMKERSLKFVDLQSVNAWENSTPEGLLTCESPVCEVQFEQTGIVRMEPRRYCSDGCRQDAWILRRAG